ncbi:TIGR04053 family radical SAM/SPASM domain-containing protein [Actinomarinicola tropica]|uniref:TIGR04053 family radical SAM/SPASM domain-containing protein n=1 Tax=Actinomarinicola tropica TaxID=2789776 RepID=A0A5Q2RCN1_9ACTN|nr:TIGR04053 family radical SAM/SPASM domain-containing protein [Actinomarinicola tropica]QGG94608.1 TIGR04053 family radical SAM/SPASM domain-containing protein [Actinomarinicola tropica]
MTLTTAHPIRELHQDVEARPFIVIWEVTRACQLACRHCRATAIPHRDPLELTTEEGRALLDDLAAVGAPRPMVVLTGGDPFERPDLVELVRHGTERGLHVAVSPSVTPRLTRDALVELRDAGAKAVSLSLDGSDAASHDGFRGIPGVFDATVDAARTVRELGIRLQINTTVTADNVTELPDVLARVVLADVSLWSVFFLVPTGRGQHLTALSPGATEEVLHWLHDVGHLVPVKATEAPHFRRIALQRAGLDDLDRRFPLGPLRTVLRARTDELMGGVSPGPRRPRPPLDVNAGRGFAFVDHHGEVYPSGFLPLSAGSVRQAPLTEIYRSSPLMRSLRDPSLLRGRCGVCDFASVCGGSRSHAYATSGDPLGEDPSCLHQPPASGATSD